MDLGTDIFSKFVATCSKFHQILQKTENKLHNVQFRHTTSIRSTTHIYGATGKFMLWKEDNL